MNHEVVGIDQDGDGVVVSYRNRANGEERTIRAKYAVAADGANSYVRDQARDHHHGRSGRPAAAGH